MSTCIYLCICTDLFSLKLCMYHTVWDWYREGPGWAHVHQTFMPCFSKCLVCLVTEMEKDRYVTRPAKINHLSTKNCRFYLFLLYHTFITIYTTTTKSPSPLQNLMGFLLQFMELGYYVLNKRY